MHLDNDAGLPPGAFKGYGVVPNKAMPNVFDAIAVDLTDYTSPYGSVHIRDKTSVGERLAAAGMATVYKQASTYWQGPTATSAAASDFAPEAGVGTLSSPSPMSSIVITFGNTGAAGLSVNKTAGACSKGVCQAPFEVCTLIAAAHSSSAVGNNCSVVQTASGGAGNWSAANISGSTDDTVTLALSEDAAAAAEAAGGKMVVRYAWAAVPFDYKQAAVYARAEAFPAGPFLMLVQ